MSSALSNELFLELRAMLQEHLHPQFALLSDKWPLPDLLRWVADRVQS